MLDREANIALATDAIVQAQVGAVHLVMPDLARRLAGDEPDRPVRPELEVHAGGRFADPGAGELRPGGAGRAEQSKNRQKHG